MKLPQLARPSLLAVAALAGCTELREPVTQRKLPPPSSDSPRRDGELVIRELATGSKTPFVRITPNNLRTSLETDQEQIKNLAAQVESAITNTNYLKVLSLTDGLLLEAATGQDILRRGEVLINYAYLLAARARALVVTNKLAADDKSHSSSAYQAAMTYFQRAILMTKSYKGDDRCAEIRRWFGEFLKTTKDIDPATHALFRD